VFDYWRERLPLRVFGPLAVALAGPAQVRPAAAALALDALFAFLLLAQFRLWDDLADRVLDAITYPNRVLARSHHVKRYVFICIALASANVWIVVSREGTMLGLPLLIALTTLLALGYLRQSARSAGSDLLRLAKYPALVLIIAAGRPNASGTVVFIAATLAYLAACTYEVWHDPATPLRLLIRSSR
jgi:hypothetical protein